MSKFEQKYKAKWFLQWLNFAFSSKSEIQIFEKTHKKDLFCKQRQHNEPKDFKGLILYF